jgi:hypothetical protein
MAALPAQVLLMAAPRQVLLMAQAAQVLLMAAQVLLKPDGCSGTLDGYVGARNGRACLLPLAMGAWP